MRLPERLSQLAVTATARAIGGYVRRTPFITLAPNDLGLASGPVTLKLELLQHSGSFKVRGAFANLALRSAPPVGVVAASGGNHGAAVAFAAKRFSLPAKIFVPRISSPAKIERIRNYGADLVVVGDSYADALAASEAWAADSEALKIHAFDQEETILGQGTLGLELEEQVPELDTVMVSVGGGGLLAGLATWYGRRVRLVGVEPKGAPTLTQAMAAGRPVDCEAVGIAADSLGPRRVGELVFQMVQPCVDRVVLVGDEDIRSAQRKLWDLMRVAAEPGGVAALAALLSGAYRPGPTERVAVVISGGNTNPGHLGT
ncbi:MAG: threonine/serine dehydratase [Myxococcaceae bacterium]